VIVLFPIQNIPDEGHYSFRKNVGSALTETENWDLLVDCTSRDSRQMLDAGVHLSDKRTYRFKHSTKYSTKSERCIFRHMHFSTATHDFGYRLSTDDK
jgi:hypothetical protein